MSEPPEALRRAIDLCQRGDFAGALRALGPDTDERRDNPDILRMRGYVLQMLGRPAEAADCYRRLVERGPEDFEAWNNLGNACREAGDAEGAVAALDRAARLRPDIAIIQQNLGGALAAAGRLEDSLAAIERAVAREPGNPAFLMELSRAHGRLGRPEKVLPPLEQAARLAPRDPGLQVELGLAHAALGGHGRAEEAYRRALDLRPDFAPAYLQLGLLLEHGGRADELAPLLREADERGVPSAETAFIRALVLKREGRLEEALDFARSASASVEPHRRMQLIGEIADRLGDTAAAFAAFRDMNRVLAETSSAPRAEAARYRDEVERIAALTTSEWFAGWTSAEPDPTRPSPVFLVGFPRSGTTLLDTILAGHPGVRVLEEEPLIQSVYEELGGFEALPGLGKADVDALRARYFEELDARASDAGERLIIDKMPLNIPMIPLIHRLFPDARFIFAERHPCDVVLSCFITNFRLNPAMANFLDLEDAARLYDLVLGHWEKSRAVFPLRVRTVRYENMVEDPGGAVRPLMAFLGLPWDETMLDHRRTAAKRGYIASASYAQVTEPIHARARGRWERYRDRMRDVLPILEPWAQRLGYDI